MDARPASAHVTLMLIGVKMSRVKNATNWLTQLSFVNQLVAFLTLDIFTPMSIKVTCAEAGRASISPTAPTIDVGANATAEQIRDAISRAAGLSLRTGEPVYVEY